MTNGYVINVGDASAKQWVSFAYEKTLNAMSNCQLALDGVTSGYSSEFEVDKEIEIYKNGTLKYRGKVIGKQDLTAGGVILTSVGIEEELSDQKCPMVGAALVRTWNTTSDHTILSTLVTSVSGWTIDISNSTSSTLNSFRVSASESVWNGVINLIEHTGKDTLIDQANKKVYLYDELTRADQFSFIEGKNASGIRRNTLRSKAGKVIVYGKGDGDFQIIGSSGSGTPVHTIIDRNIVSDTEADARALIEYNKLHPQPKRYNFVPTYAIDSLRVGDMGNISNNSAGIDEEVDIVRIKTSVAGNGVEKIDLEVTNPDLRLASKNSAEANAQSQAGYNQSQSSMQGSGNLSQWANIINGNNAAGLKINFDIGDRFEDEAGNLRIASLTVDYDIDPYRREVGTATESNKEPDIASGTYSSSDNESTEVDDDTYYNSGITFADSWTGYKTWTNIPEHGEAIIFHIQLTVVDWFSTGGFHWAYCRIKHVDDTDYYPSTTGLKLLMGHTEQDTDNDTHSHSPISGTYYAEGNTCWSADYCSTGTGTDTHNHEYYVDLNGSAAIYIPIDPHLQDFEVQLDHNASGNASAALFAAYYVVSQHKHGNGDYKTDLHKHDVSVGDAVSDAGSLNCSNVTLYLEYWNTGTSNWDTKVTVTPSPAATLDTDVDMTGGGTYPDAKGWWRVRILTNNASPDLIQGICSVTHNLDNN